MAWGELRMSTRATDDETENNDVVVCETELVLRRPLQSLAPEIRGAIASWLRDHGIDPVDVALDAPVSRHELSRSVSWHEQTPDGLLLRRRFPPVINDWPAPFPRCVVAVNDPDALDESV